MEQATISFYQNFEMMGTPLPSSQVRVSPVPFSLNACFEKNFSANVETSHFAFVADLLAPGLLLQTKFEPAVHVYSSLLSTLLKVTATFACSGGVGARVSNQET